LPGELSDLYAFFLRQIKNRLELHMKACSETERWFAIYPAAWEGFTDHPGILAIAFESLSVEQIKAWPQ